MPCKTSTFSTSASGLPVAIQAPVSRLDYGFDWASDLWLAPGEVITNAEWSQSHAEGATPLTLESPAIAGGVTLVWVTGGTIQRDYRVTVTITTSAGRVEPRSFILQVRER